MRDSAHDGPPSKPCGVRPCVDGVSPTHTLEKSTASKSRLAALSLTYSHITSANDSGKMEESSTANQNTREIDILPPVEPPTAGFIVQLFVIPAAIVAVIVIVSLLFNWLAHMGSDPLEYIETIEMGRLDAWQAAHDLATELSRAPELRSRPELASKISGLLLARLEAPRPASPRERESHDNLVYFLCAALGQFRSQEALEGLLAAAQTDWDDEADVRLRGTALESIAMLAHSCNEEGRPLESASTVPVVAELSRSDDPRLRKRAAYTLGILGKDNALSRLEFMLTDAHPDVRFNAAAGLSRHEIRNGVEQQVIEVLREMLDPEGVPAGADPDVRANDEAKQVLVLKNGLRATAKFGIHNATANLESLHKAVVQLRKAVDDGNLPPEANSSLQVEINQTLRALDAKKT